MKKFSSFKKTKEADEGRSRKGEGVSESPSVSGIDSSSSSSVDEEEEEQEEEVVEKKRKREKRTRRTRREKKQKKLSDAEKIAILEEKYGREMAKDERAFDDRSYMNTENKECEYEGATSTDTGGLLFFSDTPTDSGNLAFGKPISNEKVNFKRENERDVDKDGATRRSDVYVATSITFEKENDDSDGEDAFIHCFMFDDNNISYGKGENATNDAKMIQKLTQTVFGATKGTIEDIYKLNDKALHESVDILLKSTTNESEKLRELTKILSLTRRDPRNVKRWIAFINHQDNFLARSKKQSERERIKEKTIAICERALEWNPNDERLHARAF